MAQNTQADWTLVYERIRSRLTHTLRVTPLAHIAAAAVLGTCGIGITYGLLRILLGSRQRRVEPEKQRGAAPALLNLDEHELNMARNLIDPEALTDDFSNIGGLSEILEKIQTSVLLPLARPDLFAHSGVAQQPTGVLLYGPPGTGKTTIARAIARTAKAKFLCINAADIQSKWFGETPKLVQSIFSLARKCSPCIIFIDEIDGILAARNVSDVSHVNTMKTTFLECWDGLRKVSGSTAAAGGDGRHASTGNNWVLLLGATNKPDALDPAVDRRMSLRMCVPLPNQPGRADILRILLRSERAEPRIDVDAAAERADGYSGSDLKEVVRIAALVPIQEKFQRETHASTEEERVRVAASPVRPISSRDLLLALEDTRPSGSHVTFTGGGTSGRQPMQPSRARAEGQHAAHAAAWKLANCSASPVAAPVKAVPVLLSSERANAYDLAGGI